MINFVNPLLELDEYRQVLSSAKSYTAPVNIAGLSESQKAHICHALCRHSGYKGIFVAFNEMQARKLFEDFAFFWGDNVFFYPNKEIMLYDVEAKSNDMVYQRLTVLDRIMRDDYAFIVASAEAVSHKLVHPGILKNAVIEAGIKSRIDLDSFSRKLVMMAYERVETVERRGQFAIRGGIADVFSIDAESAVRLELFGDEVDSIRKFDVNTQRSTEALESVRIIPAREIIYTEEKKPGIIKAISSDMAGMTKRDRRAPGKIEADIERIKEEWYFPGIDRYIAYIADEPYSLLDYAAQDAVVFIDEPARHGQRLENLLLEHAEICRSMMEKGQLLPQSANMFFDFYELLARLEKKKTFFLSAINAGNPVLSKMKVYDIPGRTIGSFRGDMNLLQESLAGWKKNKNRVLMLSGTKGRGERLRDALLARGVEVSFAEEVNEPVKPGQVIITRGSLHKGFEYPSIGFVVVSDEEVFGQDRRKRVKVSGRYKGRPISAFSGLSIGDYVVHQSHGIGQYIGIEKLSVEGVNRIISRYGTRTTLLYIPTNQLDLIQNISDRKENSRRSIVGRNGVDKNKEQG